MSVNELKNIAGSNKPAGRAKIFSKTNTPYPRSRILSSFYNEYKVTEALLSSNLGVAACGYLSTIVSRLIVTPIPFFPAIQLLLKGLLLAFGFLYVFDVVNQAMAVAEDAVNKSYRPIPSGLITLRGAYQRGAIAWLLYPSISYILSGRRAALWALFWQANVAFFYVWPRPNNFVVRNMFVVFGMISFMRHSNAVAADMDPDLDTKLVLHAALIALGGVTIQIQEFHDVAGDRLTGRRSLPVILGERGIMLVRQLTCGILVVSNAAFLMWGMKLSIGSPSRLTILAVGYLQMVLGAIVGLRVMLSTSAQMDKTTYHYWYTLLFWIMILYVTLLDTVM